MRIFAVEPEESPVISGGEPGKHAIEGIGAGFIPKNFDRNLIDEVVLVSTADAKNIAEFLAKNYGLHVGPSTGANVLATMKIKEKYSLTRVVTIQMDGGIRYI